MQKSLLLKKNNTKQPQQTQQTKNQGKKGEAFHLNMGMQQLEVLSQLKYYR